MSKRILLLGGLTLWALPCLDANPSGSDRAGLKPMLRQPVALVLAQDGQWLFAANQHSGTISIIDTKALRTVGEMPVGRKLADLAATPDGGRLVAVDEEAGELIVLSRAGSALEVEHRLKVSPTPVSVQMSRDGARCIVASLWPRQLTKVELGNTPRISGIIDLPFIPRNQLLVNDTKLVVTEAFGGRLAVVDLERKQVESVRSLPAHNIRGLALSSDGKRLLLTHEKLYPLGHASFDDIHWGNLLTNNVRALRVASVLDPKADLLLGSDLLHLGDAGHGTGDPASVAACSGQLVVSLAGVDELAIGREHGDDWQYVKVGRRPTALAPTADGKWLFVASTFADSVALVDVKKHTVIKEIPLGPRPQLTSADRGEMLFYDARLSHDGWLSCHSCHTDGHTNSQLADTLSDGSYGTPKRILSLRGVGDTAPWAWNGHMPTLEVQVQKSIETTMQGMKPTAEQVRDLTAFLKTLPPPPPRLTASANDEVVRRGHAVFTKHACNHCHTPPQYTSAKSYDVGVADEAGRKQFNPPSLRGVGQGGPYFHDGRAASLRDVFAQHRHQLKGELARGELDELLQFLGSL